MKNIFILKILDLFAFMFKGSDMDYSRIRLLLQLKFNIDRRRVPLGFRNIKVNPDKDRNLFIYSLGFFALMGVLFLTFVAMLSFKSLILGSIVFFVLLMVFMFYSVVLEFSQNLFDITERNILLPKPVTPKEINTAKNLHIIIYMVQIAVVFSLPTLIFWGIYFGIITAVVSLFAVILNIFFVFVCSAFLYGSLLKKFSGEKLKDILNLVQIFTMVGIFVGYQVFMQTAGEWIQTLELSSLPNWLYLLPPVWYAAVGVSAKFSLSLVGYLAALAGIVSSVFGYKFYLSTLAPRFEKDLYKLTLTDKSMRRKKPHFALKFSGLFKLDAGKALYKLSVRILSRERKIKQAVYPMLAMGLVYPGILIFRMKANFSSAQEGVISDTPVHFFMYFVLMMFLPISIYLVYSENSKAANMFRYLPIKNPGSIIKSGQVAMFFTYQAILLVTVVTMFFFIWKFSIIPHAVALVLNSFILQLIYQNFGEKKLPFSEEMKTGQNTAFRQGSYLLSVFVFVPLLGGMHFAATLLDYGVYGFIVMQIVAFWLLFKNHYEVDWKDL